MKEPRIPPLDTADIAPAINDLMAQVLTGPGTPNGVATLARCPDLITSWLPFMSYVRFGSSLTPVTVELLVLRTQYRLQCAYEWGAHVRLALAAGVSDEQVAALSTPVTHPVHQTVWGDDGERVVAMLSAVDQLVEIHDIDDETYDRLSTAASEAEVIDLITVVGNYTTVAMQMKALRVVPDAGSDAPLPSVAE